MRYLELLDKNQAQNAFKNIRNLIITVALLYITIFLGRSYKPLALLIVFPVAFLFPYVIKTSMDIFKQRGWKFINTHETNDLITFYSKLADVLKKNGLENFFARKRVVFCSNNICVGIMEFAHQRVRSKAVFRYKIFAISQVDYLDMYCLCEKEPFLKFFLYQTDKNIKDDSKELIRILENIELRKSSLNIDHL